MIRKGQKFGVDKQFTAAEEQLKKTLTFIATSVKDIDSQENRVDILKQVGVMHELVLLKMRTALWKDARTQAAYAYELLMQWKDHENSVSNNSDSTCANFTSDQLRLKTLLCIKIGTCLAYEGDLEKALEWYKESISGLEMQLTRERTPSTQQQLAAVQKDAVQIQLLLSKHKGSLKV
jgi:tetratricopeptide (TPR) repeat protein